MIPTPAYAILVDYGPRIGLVVVERDPADMTWDKTVGDLCVGTWDNWRQVIEFDLVRGTCCDVTQRAQKAVWGAQIERC